MAPTSESAVQPGEIVAEDDLLSNLEAPRYEKWLQSIDAILLLGGGVPLSPTEPPPYVRRRCDVVARVMSAMRQSPAAVCLSAGTAHVPQYITPRDGLPLWESTASAACLMRHGRHPVPESQVYAETTSYDTISNAFFSRTTMTDVAGWRRILVVTNEFHIHRSKAIFDWIFGVPAPELDGSSSYELYYLSCRNDGLSAEALESRRSHEARGEANVRDRLAKNYTTLRGVWEFLTEKHDFFAANRLVRRGMGIEGVGSSDNLLKVSYGKTTNSRLKMVEYKNGNVILSVDPFVGIAVLLIGVGIFFSFRSKEGRVIRNPFR